MVSVDARPGGDPREHTYLGKTVFAPRETGIAWMQAPAEWHGEHGWVLALLVPGHIATAVGWHLLVRRDGALSRMAR